MYNSRQRPYVPHCIGTELMIEHVERYWCPTIGSTAFLGGQEFRFNEDKRRRVVFLIGEDEYKTWETLPVFAKKDLEWRGLQVTVVQQRSTDKHNFPGLVDAVRDADLLFVSVRRRALPKEQLEAVRAHLDAGRPLIGIRTASHGFAPRDQDAARGAAWPTFDPDVLGGHYTGHHGNETKSTLAVASGGESNPILTGVDVAKLIGNGSLYKVSPLQADATPILMGAIPGQPAEPVAWTRAYGPKRARVFYTSLGHPQDFEEPAFRRLLLNAIQWALDQPVPSASAPLEKP
jgi:type 1 glutamine amidotransferase